MGNSSSKSTSGGAVLAAAPPPQPPYAGDPVQYHYVVINAALEMQAHLSFLTPNVDFQSTNIDAYFPQLASMYQQGYRMLVFVALPASTKGYGFSNIGRSTVTMKFQGVFRKLFPEEINERWELRVEKSTIINQMFHNWNGCMFLSAGVESGSTTSSFHIFQTIANISQMGGRLISVELTGMAGQQLEMQRMMTEHQRWQYLRTGQFPMMQVVADVFYEVPLHPNSDRYNYQIVPCPMISTFQMGFQGRFVSTVAWEPLMSQYLGTGWKLVEVFDDQATRVMQQGLTSQHTLQNNCLWIFEKPQSRMNDNTPYFECTMVEHWFQTNISMKGLGFGGAEVSVNTNWEPLIDKMGQSGWQVVRILETPDVTYQGIGGTTNQRQMIFFQRKIVGRNDFGQGLPPPSYTETNTEKQNF